MAPLLFFGSVGRVMKLRGVATEYISQKGLWFASAHPRLDSAPPPK